ncbi:hypothetical protein JG687_00006560 [Phytophthora cactorum]|uniref:Peptidase M14 domain-containing protein n=1 Tax=Phytophthora cactorum TaxID=29920 RepID=A0A8T1UKQ2_9STRA|nr:hypothetical protein JG687_00006560 [Phytophthora cactorum]
MLKAQLNGRTMAIKSPHQAAASNEILLGSSSAVAVKLPCVKDVADAFHNLELVWHDEWLRWYVDGVMLLEEFTLEGREDDKVLVELSVKEATLTVERIELSSANASDPYCAPQYSISSNCREQESFLPRLGSVRGSLSVVEVDAFIDQVAAKYPLITKVEDLGRSVEGRPLRALCLGACDALRERKIPQALFTGMHHAREPISMMNLVYTIDILTSDYSNGDLAALELLTSRQLWFILVVNPDGYAHNEMARVWEHNKMGQRKSGAPTCDRSPPDAGVDLNRNYDACFARDSKGSSNDPCGDDYNGPRAFSEPETQAVRSIVERNTSDFSVALNYHSYGKYFNLPFACQAEGQPTEPNNSMFMALAREMAHFNGFNYGQSWKDSNLYTVNGETSDWMWQAHGIFAMSPEVGPGFEVASVPGFWPSADDVPQLSSELHYSNVYLARMAGPVYALEVKSVQLGTIDDGGSTASFVSVEVVVSNSGLRPGSAELLGSLFVNGTSASDPVHLELNAEPEGSGEQSHTLMIPYTGDDFHQSMREIKDLPPTVIVYGLPQKDCAHGFSTGGSNANTNDYRVFLQQLAASAGDRQIVYILEPDAVGLLADNGCGNDKGYAANLGVAMDILSQNGNAELYLDVGYWTLSNDEQAAAVAQIVNAVDPDSRCKGISLNTSNYRSNAEMIATCERFVKASGRDYKCIVDTSRNFVSGSSEWCNSEWAGIGEFPTSHTGSSVVSRYIWAKPPGESDGECTGQSNEALRGPSAGTFFPDHFVKLWDNGVFVQKLGMAPINAANNSTVATPAPTSVQPSATPSSTSTDQVAQDIDLSELDVNDDTLGLVHAGDEWEDSDEDLVSKTATTPKPTMSTPVLVEAEPPHPMVVVDVVPDDEYADEGSDFTSVEEDNTESIRKRKACH